MKALCLQIKLYSQIKAGVNCGRKSRVMVALRQTSRESSLSDVLQNVLEGELCHKQRLYHLSSTVKQSKNKPKGLNVAMILTSRFPGFVK